MIDPPMSVGFIGLGSQGGPMAHALIDAGWDTNLWARRLECLDPYLGIASFAKSPKQLAERSDVICICVRDDADVQDVMLRDDGILAGIRPESIVAIHSTISPSTCIQLGARCADMGAALLDAPVSGGGAAATDRELLVMVGGEVATFQRARPIFSAFGDPILFLGPLGMGQFAKLVNNLLFTASISLAHQAVQLGLSLGLDAEALINTLQHGSSRSFALDTYAGFRSGFEGPSPSVRFVAGLLHKDIDLFERLINERNAESGSLIEIAAQLLRTLGQPL